MYIWCVYMKTAVFTDAFKVTFYSSQALKKSENILQLVS